MDQPCAGFGSSKKPVKPKKRRVPSIMMPKSKKKSSATEVPTELPARVPTPERREEEEFDFNYYSRKRVKLTMVVEAVSKITDIKRKRRRS